MKAHAKKRVTGFVARTRILSALFILFAALLTLRLYFVQIVHGKEYRESALGQYVEPSKDMQDRGDIFFTRRGGDFVAAAVMQAGWRIAIVPKELSDPEATYAVLSTVLTIDRDRFFESASRKKDPYEEVGFHLSNEEASEIRAKKLQGVILVQDKWRNYPASTLAAHVVGFVGWKGDRKVGVYGLEAFYEDTLKKISSGLYVNPFAEIFTNVGAALSPPLQGHNGSIVTSIEPNVQARLEEILTSVVKTYRPRTAGAIVMDPSTGEIVAMAARPTYDPNAYNIVQDPSVFSNVLVEHVYEMGSIMKPLTLAAGIDVGSVNATTTYYDAGCIERSGKTICNYDGKARHVVTMQEVLNQSLNLGATFVEEQMGHNVFREYVHAFGLGEKTGIDLPNEGRGIVRSLDRGYDVDFASASFGQGIAVTGVEMIRALASLGNGGVLPTPHVVSGVRLESGIVRSVTPLLGPRVLRAETAEEVSNMLVEVFDKALLGGVLRQEHYSIAAKTGTAQIPIPNGSGYYEDRYLHSFFGYFPAHEPKFIVFLMAVEPHGAEFASATLARPFLELTKFLINYYDIPPDR